MKWYRKGSYTVEAAFIAPMVLGIAFAILYMVFVLHDKAMLQANLDNVIFLLAEGEEIDKEEYNTYLSKALWFTEPGETEITDGVVTVSGKVKSSANLSIPILTDFISGRQTTQLSEAYGKIQPEMIIRYGADSLRKKEKEG